MKKKKLSTENFWTTTNEKKFIEKRINIHYDEWQWDYINSEGDTSARIGRQSGKSEALGAKLGLFAIKYKPPKPGLHFLITGSVERQAYELYMKMRRFVEAVAPTAIKSRPTMRKMVLKSGLTILSLPCGRDGSGLRNYACAKLAIDEAHFVEEEVFIALKPMLLTTGGTMDLISTTRGDKGFFRDTFRKDSGFKNFHLKTREVILSRKICESWTEVQREFALTFINKEQKRMTKNQFKQEYEAEFMDSLQQLFTTSLINTCIVKERGFIPQGYYLGVDFAGYGGDENAFVSVSNKYESSFIEEIRTSERVSANLTIEEIRNLNKKYGFKKIGVDDGGLGSPILDFILTIPRLSRKTVGLNNARRLVDKDGMTKNLLKEDMYGNLKLMMERGEIKFMDDEKLITSLLSIQFEIDEKTKKVIIHGKYTHITEALIRAMWLIKRKGLNILAFC